LKKSKLSENFVQKLFSKLYSETGKKEFPSFLTNNFTIYENMKCKFFDTGVFFKKEYLIFDQTFQRAAKPTPKFCKEFTSSFFFCPFSKEEIS